MAARLVSELGVGILAELSRRPGKRRYDLKRWSETASDPL